MNHSKILGTIALIIVTIIMNTNNMVAQDGGADNFYKSDNVVVKRVTFKNQFNMEVVGNLFTPGT